MSIELRVTDMIIVSVADKQTGLYKNQLVTNRPRWNKDSNSISDDLLLHIEIFPIGAFGEAKYTFYSVEEFEEKCQIT